MIKAIVDGACGQMGRMIVKGISQAADMQLVGAVEMPAHPLLGKDAGEVAGVGRLGVPVMADLSEVIEKGDVVIEFTAPKATIHNLEMVVAHQKAMVIATTGYSIEELERVKELTKQIPCVMTPNMSVGVNVLFRIVKEVAQILGDDYDVEIIETHHNLKKDAPSGTAVKLAEVVASALNRNLQTAGVYGRKGIVGERTKKEIGVHAIRGGDIVGDHTVLFAGSGERIEITHRTQSREAFARGALRAARWVVNAPKGLHDVSEVLFSN